MNQIINKENLIEPDVDLVSVLLDMMNTTGDNTVATHHNVLFSREGNKLRVEGPECEVNYELLIAIDQMKQNILQRI